MTLPLLSILLGCDNSATEALMTCNGGNMEACYKDGRDAADSARPRFTDARKAFSAACMNSHHPEACNSLGILVRDAKGGPRDSARAAELFEIACKGGVKTSCVDLGVLLYDENEGLKQEPARAVELFTTACNSIDAAVEVQTAPPLAYACDRLGTAYRDGVGVEPPKVDEDKAIELFGKACTVKFAPACVASGDILVATKRKEKIAEAATFYERACKLDARTGCFELASIHEKKEWPEASDDRAALFFQKTCNINPPRGCFEAGNLMETGRVVAREGEIEYLYNLACEHGHTEACTRRKLD